MIRKHTAIRPGCSGHGEVIISEGRCSGDQQYIGKEAVPADPRRLQSVVMSSTASSSNPCVLSPAPAAANGAGAGDGETASPDSQTDRSSDCPDGALIPRRGPISAAAAPRGKQGILQSVSRLFPRLTRDTPEKAWGRNVGQGRAPRNIFPLFLGFLDPRSSANHRPTRPRVISLATTPWGGRFVSQIKCLRDT